MGHSPAMEDYLKAIYVLQSETGERVRTSELADYVGVTAPTATSMISKLTERGLVEHEKYNGVSLTTDGELAALEIIRHHRLLEAYLLEHLDYPWSDVHDEADRLEHHISEEFVDRVAAALDDPETDPHGDPIPNAALDRPDERVGSALSECEEEATVVVERVSDRDPETLEYLGRHGIFPGAILTIREIAPFGLYTLDPVDGDGPVALPDHIAARVRVAKAEAA